MKFDLQRFQQRKDALVAICVGILPTIDELGIALPVGGHDVALGDILRDIIAKCKSHVFRVLIAGEFNSGKSFFINTLLSQWQNVTTGGRTVWKGLLGVDIVPATTLLTELSYGVQGHAILLMRDGRRLKIALEDVPSFTDLARFAKNTSVVDYAEILEPLARCLGVNLEELALLGHGSSMEVSKWLFEAIDRALVFVSSEILSDGIVLVDSPGLGAVYVEHETVTRAEMRRADAIVFLADSSNPLTQKAGNFLVSARRFVEHLFFVQTKADLMEERDVARARAFNLDALRQLLGEPFDETRYHVVSARMYRDAQNNLTAQSHSGFGPLVQAIGTFLSDVRGKASVGIESNVATETLKSAHSIVTAELEGYEASSTELSLQKQRDLEALASLQGEAIDTRLQIDSAREALEGALVTRMNGLREALTATFAQHTSGQAGIFDRLLGTAQERLSLRLRIAAEDFNRMVIAPDVRSAARGLSEVLKIGFPIPRFSLPDPRLDAAFLARLLNATTDVYASQVQLYGSDIELALRKQVQDFFALVEQRKLENLEAQKALLVLKQEALDLANERTAAEIENARIAAKARLDKLNAALESLCLTDATDA